MAHPRFAASLIETCKRNCVDPAHLAGILTRIANDHPINQLPTLDLRRSPIARGACRIWITGIAFHDGTITAAAGSVPGDVEFTIDCDCIREELHQSPGLFLLRVTNCTLFEIAPCEIDHALDGFEALDTGELEILDAIVERGVVEVSNATGLMRLCYESEVLMLDDGMVISLRDLIDAANRSVGDY